MKKRRPRKIPTPIAVDGRSYRLRVVESGEIVEADDLAPLLRIAAKALHDGYAVYLSAELGADTKSGGGGT